MPYLYLHAVVDGRDMDQAILDPALDAVAALFSDRLYRVVQHEPCRLHKDSTLVGQMAVAIFDDPDGTSLVSARARYCCTAYTATILRHKADVYAFVHGEMEFETLDSVEDEAQRFS